MPDETLLERLYACHGNATRWANEGNVMNALTALLDGVLLGQIAIVTALHDLTESQDTTRHAILHPGDFR